MIKPSDVIVLFALAESEGDWTLRSLAERLGVKHSKVQRALERLGDAGIYDAPRRQIVPHAAEEFVIHALRYLDPVREGPIVRGVATAWAAAPLSAEIASEDAPPVWPDPRGGARGPSVTPLDDRLPALASTWPEVAEMAALADALRLGDARSRAAAERHLRARLAAQT